jgi:serine/threonine protein kinase
MSESGRYEAEARVSDEELRALVQADLGPEYDLRDRLARGHWSVIYRAGQRILDRWLAVKVLRVAGPATKLAHALFMRGAQVLGWMDHRHILPIYGLNETTRVCYQLLPVMRESLAAVLLREGPFPPRQAARIMREVAMALDCVHGAGLVHRDIKPQHILLQGAERRVRLTDFSMATLATVPGLEGARQRRPRVGTPAYISPEQIDARPELDGRSDLYSLGAVGYELLTGSPPFPGPAERQLVAHCTFPPDDPGERVPYLGRDLPAIVMRCLAKRPNDRWASAAELAEALDPFAG